MTVPVPSNAVANPALHLDLAFARRRGSVAFVGKRYRWPNVVSRLFPKAGSGAGTPFVIVQGAGAAMHSGDRFRLRIAVSEGARVEVRGQGAVLVNSDELRATASENARLEATGGSLLVYRQEPRILTERAALEQRLDIRLDGGSAVLVCESTVVHPKAAPAGFGSYRSVVSIGGLGGDRVVFEERQQLVGPSGPLHPYPAFGTVYIAVGASADWPDRLRQAVAALEREHDGSTGAYAAVSELPNACGVCIKVAAVDGLRLRTAVDRAMSLAAEALLAYLDPVNPEGGGHSLAHSTKETAHALA